MTLSAFSEKMHDIIKLYKLREDKSQREKKEKEKKNKELCYNLEVGRIKLVWCPHFYVSGYGNPTPIASTPKPAKCHELFRFENHQAFV